MMTSEKETLDRIHAALEEARTVLNRFTPGAIEAQYKVGTDPVTEADRQVDAVLKKNLLRPGEGWLSEETVDDFTRSRQRVASGSSIRSMAPANSCRAFPNSASPSRWLKMVSRRRWNLQSRHQRINPRLARYRRHLQRPARAAQPEKRSARRPCARQPQRSQARRVEAI